MPSIKNFIKNQYDTEYNQMIQIDTKNGEGVVLVNKDAKDALNVECNF